MSKIIWLVSVLPFVILVWCWDIFIGILLLGGAIMWRWFLKYYQFAFRRSHYLRERCICDAIYRDPKKTTYPNNFIPFNN